MVVPLWCELCGLASDSRVPHKLLIKDDVVCSAKSNSDESQAGRHEADAAASAMAAVRMQASEDVRSARQESPTSLLHPRSLIPSRMPMRCSSGLELVRPWSPALESCEPLARYFAVLLCGISN